MAATSHAVAGGAAAPPRLPTLLMIQNAPRFALTSVRLFTEPLRAFRAVHMHGPAVAEKSSAGKKQRGLRVASCKQ